MKVAVLWLINERGEILMARRAAHMTTDPNMWGPSAAGKVEPGESFEQAVLREAEEELGLDPGDISPIFLHEAAYGGHSDGRNREFGFFYAKVKGDILDRLTLSPREVSAIKWFKAGELEQLVGRQSEEVVISTATDLWQDILTNLRPITA